MEGEMARLLQVNIKIFLITSAYSCYTCFFEKSYKTILIPFTTDSSGNPLLTGLYSGPYFDLEEMKIPREFMQNGGDVLSGRTNITTQIGSSAILPCVVKQVGSNTVRESIFSF